MKTAISEFAMRNMIIPVLLLMLMGCEVPGPRLLSGNRNLTSPEGWHGKRYTKNGITISEEFDAVGNDGRIDMWRYFDDGHILAEEWDLNQDDRIDARISYSPVSAEIREIKRDTDFDGTYDIKVRYLGGFRWQENWDRNHDGTADFIFSMSAPSRLLNEINFNYTEFTDLRKNVPRRYWRELSLDTDFDHRFDQWTRFTPKGTVLHGIDNNADGRVDQWVVEEVPGPAVERDRNADREKTGGVIPPASGADGYTGIIRIEPGPGPEAAPAVSVTKQEQEKKNTAPEVRVRARVVK